MFVKLQQFSNFSINIKIKVCKLHYEIIKYKFSLNNKKKFFMSFVLFKLNIIILEKEAE